MSNARRSPHDNVPGRWYVDDTCTDCNLCPNLAAKNIKRTDDKGYSFVYKQPEGEEELQQCQEAKESCPTSSIGDDGV